MSVPQLYALWAALVTVGEFFHRRNLSEGYMAFTESLGELKNLDTWKMISEK